jgi:hypothetical protein
MLYHILLSRLTPNAEEIIEDHHSIFRRNKSSAGYMFCILKIIDKKWEYNEEVHQLFTDLKKKLMIQLGKRACIIFSPSLVSP